MIRVQSRRWTWARTRAALAAGSLAAALTLAGAAVPASARENVLPTRIGGLERVDTAARIAEQTFGSGAQTALLARADLFPDALAGASLAGAVDGDAPVLLTYRHTLPARTVQALQRLGTRRVVILGGTVAIGTSVQSALRGYEVTRIAGLNRYATAAMIARETVRAAGGIGVLENERMLYLASGGGFADALTASPSAFTRAHPILLAGPSGLPVETRRALEDLDPQRVLILGGTAAVPVAAEEAVEAMGIPTTRVSGSNRFATAAEHSKYLVEADAVSGSQVLVARGDVFADALTGAPRAGILGAPILLAVTPTNLGPDTQQWLTDNCPTLETVQALGGTKAIAHNVLAGAESAAENCDS
jgi:putative cell wall-binding protein